MEDFYDILEITADASSDDIKKSYRSLAIKYHPDKNPGDILSEEKFKKINEAHDTLKDENKRYEYDQIRNFKNNTGTSFGFNKNSPNVDIFQEMMRNMRQNRNRDVNISYHISLEDVYYGKEKEISYTVGDNYQRSIKVTIPSGADNGLRIKYTGQGDSSNKSLPTGDLYVTIHINDNGPFKRLDSINLQFSLYINYLEAVVGTYADIPVLGGGKIRLNIPKNIKYGQKLRVKGKGLKKNNQQGDLFVEVLLIPVSLEEEDFNKIQEILNKK